MSVIISDEILQAAKMTEDELRQELAVFLYAKDKLTFYQARQLVGMNRLEFQELLADHEVGVYGIEEFEEDLKTISEMADRGHQ